MTDRETLRRLAEDATPGEMYAGGVKAQQFRDAADPPTVLALLDDLDRAEAEVKRLREGIKPIVRELQGLVSRYTRAPGENGDRVADLLSKDSYEVGTRLSRLLDGGDDQ